MTNFVDSLTSGARSAACQLLGVPQYLNDMVTRLSGGLFTPPLNQIPNLWRRALCDTDAPPPDPPPFTGGQCTALYTISVTIERAQNSACDRQVDTRPVGNYWGAIGSPSLVETPGGTNNNTVNLRFTNFGSGGFPMSIPQTSTVPVWNTDSRCDPARLISVNVQRSDGQPDNCGNPDPVYPPLTPPDVEIPRDITYENQDGVSITIPVVFVFARAQLTVNADVLIPFTLNLSPTLNITGNISVSGEVNFNFGGGTATALPKDPRKGDCDDIALPVDTPPQDPTDSTQPNQPERDREETIIGVLVTVTSLENERASTIVQVENPDIYAPNLGFVNFLVRVGETSGGWTSDLPVKNRRNLIPCPWDGGAIAVRGTPQPGVTWELTEIYGYAGIPVEYIQ